MSEKTALVTAANRGLGFATAKALAEKGWRIILNGRDEAKTQTALDQLPGKGHLPFVYDLLEDDAVSKLVDFLQADNLSPDLIVHNLGGKVSGDTQPLQSDVLQKSMRLNLEVALEINAALLSQLQQKQSKIIHIGSSAGYSGNAAPAYAIAKGALNTYVKNMARYHAKDGILFCAIIPGILDHPGSEWDRKRVNEPEKVALRESQMPTGKFAKPEEIAAYIAAIAEVDNIQATGSIISLEGGV